MANSVDQKLTMRMMRINLVFIFIFLNIWDFAINRNFFNGMVIGLGMFAPATFFWYLGKFRAVVLLTLISIFEFMMMLIFVLEGFELAGSAISLKSSFWVPYMMMAGLNSYFGLKIYSQVKV